MRREMGSARRREDDERELQEHVDLAPVSTPFDEAVHHVHHPGRTLTTWRALSTRLVLVELHEGENSELFEQIEYTYFGEARDGGNDVGALVHNDDCTRAETSLRILERIKVHAKPKLSDNPKAEQTHTY
jgi:hypothetical protein